MADTRIFHGNLKPSDIARDLIAYFNRGSYQVQQIGHDPKIAIQIATHRMAHSGGRTALTVTIHQVDDGVSVQVSEQAWLGIAASLGFTALRAIRNPFSLIGRIDDLAQDIESLQLDEDIWEVHAVGLPDIPKAYGGEVEFVSNPCLKFRKGKTVNINARLNPKELKYNDPIPGTNKFRFVLKHPAGATSEFQLNFELIID